ncbi:hypothetical protein PENANT_c073G06708 [Penicillium antarcticum]|uniref:Major facilitator superfamily (MFS) profile domain-containing protein n=1 Tax=Penicillium antarcticum TaxID=416450 RepID=A0A1V6PPD0_9EURO|nr:hypothetical protein PENANT_c073G06708 [Penicillium antarcticum]
MADSPSLRDCRDEVCSNRDDIPLKETGSDHSIDDEKQEYPPTLKLAPILIGLCFQSFCIALDNTILSTAVPKITEQFNSISDLSWYASAYLVTTCAVTLPFGKIYTYYSTKWTYMIALALFEIGSLVCAVTPTSKGLILGRAIAGIGSGGLSPGALLVLANSVPLHRRALYYGIIGSTSGIATITGPLWSIDRPCQLEMVFLDKHTIRCSHWTGDSSLLQRFDENEAQARHTWTAEKNGSAWYSGLHPGNSLNTIGLAMGWNELPIWFQAIKEDSASESGINNLPMVVAMIVCSALGGLLVNIVGYYTPLMFVGSVFLTIGSGLCTTFGIHTGHAKWIGYQVIIGVGAGLGFQQCINALQTVLSLDDIPIGIAIITFAQSLSGAIFISIAQTVFENRLMASISIYAPKLNPSAVIEGGAANLSQRLSKEALPSVLYAYNIAVTQTFYVSVAAALLSFIGAGLVQWKSMKKPHRQHPED